MPLKIIAARNARTKNLYIRGAYLGVRVDKSCGTDRRSVARSVLKRLCDAIERGEYPPRRDADRQRQPTFLTAAVSYLETGHPSRYVGPLIKHFGEMPLADIDQAAIDRAAVAIKPNGTPMNRCAAVYTPVSAILHFSGIDITVRRPKGWQGRQRTEWLAPADAFGVIAAADSFDPEFGTLLTWLIYTGARIGAALDLRRHDLRLAEMRAWARSQKGQPHMDIRLHPDLGARLATLMALHERERIFRLHYGAHLAHQLVRAKLGYLGLDCPKRRCVGWREPPNRLAWLTFHSFRHTWATWMRQAGADVQGLVATGNWRNEASARRYAHAVPRDEWQRVDRLPSAKASGDRNGP
jgi:integrase